MSNYLIKTLQDAVLNPQMCHSQTDVGAGNMSGKTNGAVSHLCLSKASKNLQFFDMINTIQFLGFSIKFSPNRQGKLEPQFH